MTRIAIIDTETTGLALDDDIWDFAAIVREDPAKCAKLPEDLLADHRKRFPGWSHCDQPHAGVWSRQDAAEFDRHTALGDAQWARAIWDAVTRHCGPQAGDSGEPLIAVYTRNGGGNRECYCDSHPEEGCLEQINQELTLHPFYVRDADDECDCTYATFWFKAPAEYRKRLAEVAG